MQARPLSVESPNAALARELWLAAAAGDSPSLTKLLAEDVEWRTYGHNPLTGKYRSRDVVIDHIAGFADHVDDCRFDLLDILTGSEAAVIRYRLRASRGAACIDEEVSLHLEIEAGRVRCCTVVPDDQVRHDEFLSANHH